MQHYTLDVCYKYIAGEEYDADSFGIFLNRYQCTHKEDLHTHDFLELAYVVNGEGKHFVGNTSYNISQGSIFIINNTEAHEFGPLDSSAPLDIINCCFSPSALAHDIQALNNMNGFRDFFYLEPFFRRETGFSHRLQLTGNDNITIYQLLTEMLTEFTEKRKGYQLMLKSSLINLLIRVARLYEQFESDMALKTQYDTYWDIVQQAIQYINNHIEEKISLDDVACMVNFSSSHFSRVFKRVTKKTLFEFITECRLQKAKDYLKNSNKSITEISHDVGFASVSYFGQVFKQAFGISPSEYRDLKMTRHSS